jgi:hypothetical protein
MSVRVDWFNDEKTILLTTYEGWWSWAENDQVRHKAHEMLDSVDHSVDCIYDLSKISLIPKGSLLQAQNTISQAHVNTGALVVINSNRLLGMLFRIFKRIAGTIYQRQHIHLVPTVEAAYNLISEIQSQREQAAKNSA